MHSHATEQILTSVRTAKENARCAIPQRVSAYLRQLVNDYRVERVEQNRLPYFRLY